LIEGNGSKRDDCQGEFAELGVGVVVGDGCLAVLCVGLERVNVVGNYMMHVTNLL
jgi:hypothetical protein